MCSADLHGPERILCVTYADGSFRLWNFESGHELGHCEEATSRLESTAFDVTGRYFATVSDEMVRVCVARTDDLLALAESRLPWNFGQEDRNRLLNGESLSDLVGA